MKDLFAIIYEFGVGLYGQELGDHLYGLNPNNSGNSDAISGYSIIGVLTFILILGINFLFYRVIDSPKVGAMRRWIVWNLLTAALNFGVAFLYLYKDFSTGYIALEIRDAIGISSLLGFSTVNALFSMILFLMVSSAVRRLSNNNRLTPFGTNII